MRVRGHAGGLVATYIFAFDRDARLDQLCARSVIAGGRCFQEQRATNILEFLANDKLTSVTRCGGDWSAPSR